MTDLSCHACGRPLAAETAFCPYCGVDRRPAPTPERAPPSLAALPLAPAPATPAAPAPEPTATSGPRAVEPSPAAATAATPASKARPAKPRQAKPRRKGGGCGLRLLVALMLAAALLAWCAVHAGGDGPPAVAGAVAVQPLRVTRRWRTTALPGDAPANARFAVSSDTALRVRANGRVYAVRPGHPLRLPEDLGDSIEVRAESAAPDAATHARATLSTLRGG